VPVCLVSAPSAASVPVGSGPRVRADPGCPPSPPCLHDRGPWVSTGVSPRLQNVSTEFVETEEKGSEQRPKGGYGLDAPFMSEYVLAPKPLKSLAFGFSKPRLHDVSTVSKEGDGGVEGSGSQVHVPLGRHDAGVPSQLLDDPSRYRADG
jgi:hypothetical protein